MCQWVLIYRRERESDNKRDGTILMLEPWGGAVKEEVLNLR